MYPLKPDGASIGFDDHAPEIAKPLRNAVLVDMVRRRHVTKVACLKLLRQHIKENVWQVRYFLLSNVVKLMIRLAQSCIAKKKVFHKDLKSLHCSAQYSMLPSKLGI